MTLRMIFKSFLCEISSKLVYIQSLIPEFLLQLTIAVKDNEADTWKIIPLSQNLITSHWITFEICIIPVLYCT